ncbi:MAG: fasciclin domain-containing protein [Acidobacteriota bacterium]
MICAFAIAFCLFAVPASAGQKDIVDTAVAAGSIENNFTSVKAAGLVETLKGDGPFTVFAPTDDAFAKLPAGTVEALLQDKDKLTAILTYHVVPGKKKAADVVAASQLGTVQGSDLPVDTSSGVKVGEATVVQTDIHTSNGVIHVIDTVLLPPAD